MGRNKKIKQIFSMMVIMMMAISIVCMNVEFADASSPRKNAKEVAALKKLIKQQKKAGVNMRDLDSGAYSWHCFNNEVRLVEICQDGMVGDISLAAFPKLTRFVCQDAELTNLDVSKNKELEELIIANRSGELKKLDIKKNTELRLLEIQICQLKKLDVSKNTKLETINVGGNKLKKLDVSKNTKVNYLGLSDNLLTSLDVGKNKKLVFLDVWMRLEK